MCKDSDTRACLDVSGPLGLSKGGLGPQAREGPPCKLLLVA